MEQLFYDTLALLIVATAIFLTGRKVYLTVFKKKEPTCESGCNGCSSKCEIKQLGSLKKTIL